MKTPPGLREGRHGPYCVRRDARNGLWIVTAVSKRALSTFPVGRAVQLIGGQNAKLLPIGGSQEARAGRALELAAERVAAARAIPLPNLHGLNIAPTPDGYIALSGRVLPAYRAMRPFGQRTSSAIPSYERNTLALVDPANAHDVLEGLRAVEADVRAHVTRPAPDLPWACARRNDDGTLFICGRLIVTASDCLDPAMLGAAGYINALDLDPDDEDLIVPKLTRRAQAIAAFPDTPDQYALAERIDHALAQLRPSLFGDHSPLGIVRDHVWLRLSFPYTPFLSERLKTQGWRWCRTDRAWIGDLTDPARPHRADTWLSNLWPLLSNLPTPPCLHS